jgi:hypothetical protein
MLRALLALALACAGASALQAQIPGLPRPGQGRRAQPAQPTRPGQQAQQDTSRPQRPAAPADTLLDRLMQLEGYTPVEYASDSAEYRRPIRTLWLRGNPEVKREGRTLTAEDSLVYQEESAMVAAYGHPEITGEGDPVVGDVLFHNLRTRRSSVRGARTRLSDQATWLVQGDADVEDSGRRVFASSSTFTTDDREQPAYYFRADRIMIIRDRVLIGRPAYLYFRNVPVMALPFVVQDLAKGRRSGVLIPDFEINDIIRTNGGRNLRGTGREITNIGYYFALNDYLGLTLAGGWRSGTYSSVSGGLDFSWRRRFLNGSASFTRYMPTEGGSQFTLRGGGSWKPTERLDLTASADYATSSRFERNRTVDPLRQTQDLGSSISLTRRMDWGSLTSGLQVRQSLANGDETVIPSLALSLNSWTPFPATSSASRSLLNELTINPGGISVSGNRLNPGESSRRPRTETYNAGFSPSIAIGNFGVSTSASYSYNLAGAREALSLADTVGVPSSEWDARGGRVRETLDVSASTGYQIPLFAQTRLSPTISLSRQYIRADTLLVADTIGGPELVDSLRAVYGSFVGGPTRLNFGAGVSTDLYGFFPGIGEYAAIRHHIHPSISYRYSPSVGVDEATDKVRAALFGTGYAATINEVEIGLNQTFEGKLRDRPRPVRRDSAADSARSAGNAAEATEPRKVTLLSLNTSAVQYSFSHPDSVPGFRNELMTNDITSDLFGGLHFSMVHDLFSDRVENNRVVRGGFSPYLTSLQTSLSFGQNSALFRWLGFARSSESEREQERGRTPDDQGVQPFQRGNATATSNNQRVGGGPWNVSLNYSLARARPSARDTLPGSFVRDGNQQLSGSLTFSPTRNWGVTWNTGYSITSGKFDTHILNVKRDLYRWEANFDFIRAPNGNTRFGFRVHLIDLPDLKVDYDETYLGAERRGTGSSIPNPQFERRENPRQVPR